MSLLLPWHNVTYRAPGHSTSAATTRPGRSRSHSRCRHRSPACLAARAARHRPLRWPARPDRDTGRWPGQWPSKSLQGILLRALVRLRRALALVEIHREEDGIQTARLHARQIHAAAARLHVVSHADVEALPHEPHGRVDMRVDGPHACVHLGGPSCCFRPRPQRRQQSRGRAHTDGQSANQRHASDRRPALMAGLRAGARPPVRNARPSREPACDQAEPIRDPRLP